MKDLLFGMFAAAIILPAFYYAAQFCIWAYINFGEFIYGAGTMALLWALVAGAKRAGAR